MTRSWARRQCALAIIALGLADARAGAQREPGRDRPNLVVLVTIDQFRGDYLDRFGPQLTGGLARLARGGAWFTDAHHDHAITETAPGHATLLSGRYPRSTGITMNRAGVEDSLSPLLDSARGDGASPRRFVGTTLVDWMRAKDPRTRVLSVSMKDRGAILPVGRSRSDVYWYAVDGRFTTSRYYRDSLSSWVRAFNARHMAYGYAGRSWTLLLPGSAYPEPDTIPIEGGGIENVFPHRIPADSVQAASLLRLTPFIDEMTLAFALEGVRALGIGADSAGARRSDLLAVSLSGTDVIGHRYGPDSREIHDQVLQVDRLLGRFLDSLYRLRDSTRVTVVLTSDHGVGTIPELAASCIQPTPVRVALRDFYRAWDSSLMAVKVASGAFDFDPPTVMMDRAAFRAAGVNADSVLGAFASQLREEFGVARVDRFPAILADTLRDPIARRWGHQFPATAPIELVVTLTRGSTWGGNIASHGSPYNYDSHVPLIFYGAGIRPGRRADAVQTVSLAPTLAELLGTPPLERVDGVSLRAALLP
jgi:predicted AlkP superfamily pyrophosphatase or phosphodiesterase